MFSGNKQLLFTIFISILLITATLIIGMLGYHHFERLGWIDSFLNASMILSGMGPVQKLDNDAAKIFAGIYALISGLVFIALIAIALSPVLQKFLGEFGITTASTDNGNLVHRRF